MVGTGRSRGLRRVGGTAVVAVVLGVLVHGMLAYRVLQAGGVTPSSLLGSCGEAAVGRFTTSYRINEQLRVERTFLPPTATCRWSGGESATLVDAAWWSWTGPALVVVGAVVLLAVRLVERAPRRPPSLTS
jgi:hypothetical protein